MKKVLLMGLGVAACVVGFTGSAFALGQGGVAGAASFQLDPAAGTFVTSASAAVAVGKTTATAGAATDLTAAGATEAFAAGTGGAITYAAGVAAAGGSIYLASIAEETVAGLGQAQLNDLTGSSINVGVIPGTFDQTN